MLSNRNIISAIAAALSLAASILPAHADEIWNINHAKSHFGPGNNMLILERGKLPATNDATTGRSASAAFLVITGDKVYMAVDEEAIASGSAVRKVDYSRWNGMKLTLIGDHLRRDDYCSLSCQSGVRPNTVTLHFTAAAGTDPADTMGTVVAVNGR